MYRLKHKPTGLYWQTSNNLDETGKIWTKTKKGFKYSFGFDWLWMSHEIERAQRFAHHRPIFHGKGDDIYFIYKCPNTGANKEVLVNKNDFEIENAVNHGNNWQFTNEENNYVIQILTQAAQSGNKMAAQIIQKTVI